MLDADVYGFSVPRMLGVTARPTRVDDMILPPIAHGVRVISVGMFVEGNTAVVWRGPMLHRALQQFLADVYWGDLDVLLLDLPPGTGDIAISTAQLIPTAELVVVTTPQVAAAEVAERAGSIAVQTRQRIAGVVENMTALRLPDGTMLDLFGSGGGDTVATALSRITGTDVPLLGRMPLDPALRLAGDAGVPLVLSGPDSPAGAALRGVADQLAARQPTAGRREPGHLPGGIAAVMSRGSRGGCQRCRGRGAAASIAGRRTPYLGLDRSRDTTTRTVLARMLEASFRSRRGRSAAIRPSQAPGPGSEREPRHSRWPSRSQSR